DEIADHSVSYNTASTNTNSYPPLHDALPIFATLASALSAADTDAELLESWSQKKNLTASTTTILATDFTRSLSKTFFDIHLGKDVEIADHSISYNTTSTDTKSYSQNYYNVAG